MLELYFIFYRVPKMMTRLARERGRSAFKWSLLGIGVWIGTEIVIIFGFSILYGLGAAIFDLPLPVPAGARLGVYILALVAALGSVTLVSRRLTRSPKEIEFPVPPPPPDFRSESNSESNDGS
jgi:hypothetical protein